MILIPTNPLLMPVALLFWAADAYLLLVFVRFALMLFVGDRWSYRYPRLRQIVEGPVDAVSRLTIRGDRPIPPWAAWALVVLVVVVLRQILAAVIFGSIPQNQGVQP